MTGALARKASARRLAAPLEEWEQAALVDWLRAKGLRFYHVPNEGRHSVQYRAKQLRLGVSAGVPDIVITTRPPAKPEARGVAVELKRTVGGRVSPAQAEWLEGLRADGHETKVAIGAIDAIEWLKSLGYGA